MDVGAWLHGLGLGRYEQAFRDNDIGADLLPRLTAKDLRDIGVRSVGHRRRLLDAIATLDLRIKAASTAIGSAAPAAPKAPRIGVERRQVTVVFVDLVGSTALSGRLDPEDLREAIRAYQDACAAAITCFEGHVAQFLGDGILAYFGWPIAHEDEPDRAVRAALNIVRTVPRLATPADEALAARVGIATGLVVIGDLAGTMHEEAIIGETPNLAARLQQLADPGTIVVAENTRRLLGGRFALADLGAHSLRGFSKPVRAWRVAGERPFEDRFEVRRVAGLAPMIGRRRELALLLDRWRQACRGVGQVMVLVGEPGVGKSRLVEALRDRLRDEPHQSLAFQSSPLHTGTALYPIIAQLEHAAGFNDADDAGARLAKIEALLATSMGDTTDAPMLAGLLGLPTDERYPSSGLTPSQRKERTLEILLAYVETMATQRPVLLVFEDIHWLDPTTLELLGLLVDRAPGLQALAVLTARPEFSAPWASGIQASVLPLSRLDRRQAAALARRVSAKALPDTVLDQVVARADGVPLFVEELTRTVLESGLPMDGDGREAPRESLNHLSVPMTLQDSLMARLDRLASAREVAQMAACIGREFTFDTLAAVATSEAGEMRTALARLVESGIILRHGASSRSYSFRHALVQEAAYASLLKSQRQELHARIAKAAEEHSEKGENPRPEWLAHHFTEAGLIEPAAQRWLEAARRAKNVYANQEAASHLRRCLGVIDASGGKTVPPGVEPYGLEALVMLGDIAGLAGDLEEANRRYDEALATARDPGLRTRIAGKRHRPRSVVRAGARIAFYEHGGGHRPLVFVAPLAYGLAAFQPLVDRLCLEFRIITIDPRGTGASDPLTRPYRLADHVEDVRAVIGELGNGPVIGVGLSRGANLLLRLAHAEPDLFEGLVTVGGPPGEHGPPFFADDYLEALRALAAKGDVVGIVRLHTSRVFSEPATREMRELFVRNRLGLPRETMLSFFDPDPTVDVTSLLGEIAIPVLVTHGSADRLVDFRAAEFLAARLPNARLHAFAGKGHMPLFTAPDDFCEALRDFVRRCGTANWGQDGRAGYWRS